MHRTASWNEESGRYSQLKSDFYVPSPENWRVNTEDNKQATVQTDRDREVAEKLTFALESHQRLAYQLYEAFLSDGDEEVDNPLNLPVAYQEIAELAGVSREQARMVLPVNIYTRWFWKIDLKNLLHFLFLRCDGHAQYEIRVYADKIAAIIQLLFPAAWSSWEDNMINATRLSGKETAVLQRLINNGIGLQPGERKFVCGCLGTDIKRSFGWSKRRLKEFLDKTESFLSDDVRNDLLEGFENAQDD